MVKPLYILDLYTTNVQFGDSFTPCFFSQRRVVVINQTLTLQGHCWPLVMALNCLKLLMKKENLICALNSDVTVWKMMATCLFTVRPTTLCCHAGLLWTYVGRWQRDRCSNLLHQQCLYSRNMLVQFGVLCIETPPYCHSLAQAAYLKCPIFP